MTGVTILDTIETYALSDWQVILVIAPLFVAAVIMFVRMYRAFKKGTEEEQAMMVLSLDHWSPKEFIILVVGTILSFALMFSLEKLCPAKHIETQYKVSVDETVSFVEFYDKYEVLEEKADYFLVKERVD